MSENSSIQDKSAIIVSPDLIPVFEFLMMAEKEVQALFWMELRLNKIRKIFQEHLKITSNLMKQLKDNNISIGATVLTNSDFSELPDLLKYESPTRSQVIILFVFLETIFCLETAYSLETDDEKQIREAVSNNDKRVNNFINTYILNTENAYYRDNKNRFCRINAKNIRHLRNSLTHFFSLSGDILLAPKQLEEKCRKIEKELRQQWAHDVSFLSPEDMLWLISNANILLFQKWSTECELNNLDFRRKISFVKNIVEQKGSVLVRSGDINI